MKKLSQPSVSESLPEPRRRARLYKCPSCPRTFDSPNALGPHKYYTHMGGKRTPKNDGAESQQIHYGRVIKNVQHLIELLLKYRNENRGLRHQLRKYEHMKHMIVNERRFMSPWSHSICDACWTERFAHAPAKIKKKFREHESCCFCSKHHTSGIYIRHDPETLACKGKHP